MDDDAGSEVGSVTDAFAGGAALLLAVVLSGAGALKLWQRRSFAHAVHRLLPTHLAHRRELATVLGPVVAVVELAVAALLVTVAPAATIVATAAATLFLGFVAVVIVAIGKGASCGCFSSFSDDAAGPAELVRTASLALIAVGLAVADAAGHHAAPWGRHAVGAALVLAAAVLAATVAAARRGAGTADRSTSLGWTVLGRVRSRKDGVELPRILALQGAERAAVLADAAGTPSVGAFLSWLSENHAGLIVELGRSLVRVTTAEIPGGASVTCLLLVPPRRPDLEVTVSLPWDGTAVSDGVVIAVVAGRPVHAMAGAVVEAAPAVAR
jgi:hypothetical protein